MALALHVNTAATGNGNEFFTQDGSSGEVATVACWGGFGGGTLTVKMSPDAGATWLDFTPVLSFTTAATKTQIIPQGVKIRGELTSAAGATFFCSVFGAD